MKTKKAKPRLERAHTALSRALDLMENPPVQIGPGRPKSSLPLLIQAVRAIDEAIDLLKKELKGRP